MECSFFFVSGNCDWWDPSHEITAIYEISKILFILLFVTNVYLFCLIGFFLLSGPEDNS